MANRLPSAMVFDLDGCVWDPEMYELWGSGGAPFTQQSNGDLLDRSKQRVVLMGDVRNIMKEFKLDPKWKGTTISIASRCDEPSWAAECIKKFQVGEGLTLDHVFDSNTREIYKGCKSGHLKTIARKTGFDLKDMMFFDNEYGNCQTVAKMGVTTVYTPNGVTREVFENGLSNFPTIDGTILGPKKRAGKW
ncbi:hypothetical protein TCAL_03961 [Tigriopus californicus]|uniref:Magnesium-dependent phosphatase-1 n=1 Tax=Tigriopus californicus TaxID=6832 RepID=A0A553P3Z5_TIGCA|nr:magnesium-dependent phosphatase 1-like [Tigriopus californicus]TRY72414.1 hypothetical protein TCAL_03961 [Tigriopus californicus]|eukprot:TCALIF_03961-PA protein Name:"Similar to MDP1 Magnesium-dependent phosphatase 1 (Homo sapiens)" AED:0.02 eAED:0.02 QI:0/-1/0/1/-1/1/1/0/190